MNRRMRRSLSKAEIAQAQADARNAYHWAEIKSIKRDYDALPDAEKPVRKPEMAAQIDEHLAALLAA